MAPTIRVCCHRPCSASRWTAPGRSSCIRKAPTVRRWSQPHSSRRSRSHGRTSPRRPNTITAASTRSSPRTTRPWSGSRKGCACRWDSPASLPTWKRCATLSTIGCWTRWSTPDAGTNEEFFPVSKSKKPVRPARNLRDFLEALAEWDPDSILRISDPIALDYDMTAMAMELERRGQSPVLWFEKVGDSPFPVVANVFGNRKRYAFAAGVEESELLDAWGRLGDKLHAPELVKNGPILDNVHTGADVDLKRLPIPRHFAEDGGPYITNGIVVAKDPDTGVRNASFHRMQLKGPNLFGTSLHSRRHLWTYARRAEELGQHLPVAVLIGCHPLLSFGSGLWKGPISTDEYEVAGGFFGEPLKIAMGPMGKVEIPVECEFALEGTLIVGERFPEGPFAEFTGYASERSTEHALKIDTILYRNNAIFQDIVPGISDKHTMLLALQQEARLLRTL